MHLLDKRGNFILSGNGRGQTSRGFLELMARFGYVSLREVMYAQHLTLRQAMDRMRYLETCQLVRRFCSYTDPRHFFCLTASGRQVVEGFGISEEVSRFVPSNYSLLFQHHNRLLVKTFVALRQILGSSFIGWTSEESLRRQAGSQDSINQRIWDGELRLRMFNQNSAGEEWRCPVELELSLKSPYRYWKQFNALAYQIYDDLHERQMIPMMLFVYGKTSLRDHLLDHMHRESRRWGQCVFYFGQAEEVFEKLGDAPLLRVIGRERTTVPACLMARVFERRP